MRIISFLMILAVLIAALPLGAGAALADEPPADNGWVYKGKVTQEEREAAAERFKDLFFSGGETGPLPLAPGLAPDHILGADGLPIPHFFGPYPNYALSPLPTITTDPVSGNITNVTGGIRKFIDALPGLGPDNANGLGQYIPIAVKDTATFPDADYYEIALIEVEEQMHTDLPATRLRQYVQLDTNVIPGAGVPLVGPDGPIMMPDGVTQAVGVDNPHYLGPLIIVEKDRPVRIKFYNLLPTGAGGNLFIPVDTTVMGAGMGPVMDAGSGNMIDYTQNRATLHLHGGHSPWISDGTPHQWITPTNEATPYPQGVSVYPVPNMGDTGAADDGTMTFYYTNQQSARFMFYHDHAMGITRLNVYAGEAAGYIITDPVELDLVNGTNNTGVNPNNLQIIPADQIPLVIQDKTFVADNVTPFTNIFGDYQSQMAFYDPTWDYSRWGDYGDLWYPHVYMTVQNPDDPSGINAFGRWHYGPWFWPPVQAQNPPELNPYYDPVNAPWEPRYMPGVPSDSTGMESFFDTPVVNGTVYPYLDVAPKTYRFRILNAANDRFWNLQLHEADPDVVTTDNRTNTEVRMVPAAGVLPDGWAADNREGGLPDPALVGPPLIQIGTEGGFLPEPVVLPNHPIVWNLDPTTFAMGNVESGNLILGPAERADVIVDFSAFAGKTLILYNDAPAPFPALAPQYDYYTGAPDMSDTGSSPGTIAGWGPNTRTIMQIRVAANPVAAAYNLAALNEAFTPADGVSDGVFALGQDPVFVGQSAYDNVYHTTFPAEAPLWGAANIHDFSLSFKTPAGNTVTDKAFELKAIQDEMGEAFDTEYGRMSGNLGLEAPTAGTGAQKFMLYPFIGPPVDLIPIGNTYDGFQIWKVTHNGVDTHPIHFHLYEVQLLNRVAWDGTIYWPDPNELGWKETVRISPLMDTIVALKPKIPTLPFDIPNSVRLLDPTQPEGANIQGPANGFLDPGGFPVTVTNHYVNLGWEYVWHCHILSHEEMDMMHIFGVGLAPLSPTGLAVSMSGTADLTWTDESVNESHWTIQRTTDPLTVPWETVATVASTTGPATGGTISYSDASIPAGGEYSYQVLATNTFGDTTVYAAPAVGFPYYSLFSDPSNTDAVIAAPPPLLTVNLNSTPTALQVNDLGVALNTAQLVGNNFTLDVAIDTTLVQTNGFPVSNITAVPSVNPAVPPISNVLVWARDFGPNLAAFTPGIDLTVTYNQAQLPFGIQENTLQLYEWDTVTSTYVLVANQQRNTTTNTIAAPLTHFSTYVILGTPASLNLNAGWTSFSTPVKLHTSYDTWSELATAAGLTFEAAYRWNGTAFVWVQPTDVIQPLDAMYVKLTVPGLVPLVPSSVMSGPPSRSLTAGWNLVGTAFPELTRSVSSAFVSANPSYSQVFSPLGNSASWLFSRGDATVPNVQRGEGYWIYMLNPAGYTGGSSTLPPQ